MEKLLAKVFTPGQIKMLKSGKKTGIKWTVDDIAAAISLRSVSPKAYRYLRKNGFPLPGLSTLRTWANKLNLEEGILNDVMVLMKNKARDFSDLERLTVLSFDEIYISNKICIDKKQQKKLGPHRSCQTVMARGLLGQWKQPIFYKFDQPMTDYLLNNIIAQLYDSGFTVVAISSDMGTGNTALWSALNVGHDKNCFFAHPVNVDFKVFVFADIPHLLKLIRNHFIDNGFHYKGKKLDKSCLERLLNISNTELTLANKLSRYHLDVKASERQKVKPAAQIFSNTVAKAIKFCGLKGHMKETNWHETSDMIAMINNWFDLFNARSKFGTDQGHNAYGINLENQIALLDEVSMFISLMRVGRHKSLIPFQKGILLSNKSMVNLFHYLREKFGVEYVLTYRLNQDILENFFSYIRGMGGTNDHPTPLDFQHRLKWYILGKHSAAVFTQNTNTEDTAEPCLIKPLENDASDTCLSHTLLSKFSETSSPETEKTEEDEILVSDTFVQPEYGESDLSCFSMTNEVENLLENFDIETFKESVNEEALIYIAGYVAGRFRHKYTDLGVTTDKIPSLAKEPDKEINWVQFLSKGRLTYPSEHLIEATKVLEGEFHALHKNTLSNEKFLFNKLTDRTLQKLPSSIKIPHDVLTCLARTRTYIRLRDLNKKISKENCKRKLNKKLSKFTNNKL